MIEIWKDIVGYEGYYQVSDKGRVRSLDRVVILTNGVVREYKSGVLDPKPNRKGYICVNLCRGKKDRKGFKVHQLVAKAFIDNPEGKPQVDHINCVKSDNSKINLRWCTNLENQQYATLNGLKPKPTGKINPNCKLSESDVLEICNLLDAEVKQSDIASKFNVTQVQISSINLGGSWDFLTNRRAYRRVFDQLGSNNPRARSVVNCRGAVFTTIMEATSAYGVGRNSITKSCKSDTKTAGKYLDGTPIKWYYKSDYTTEFIIMDNALDGHPGE